MELQEEKESKLKNNISELTKKITKLELKNSSMKNKFRKLDTYYQDLRSKRNAVSDDLYDKTISSKTAKRRQNKFNKKIQKIQKYIEKLEKQHPTIQKEDEIKNLKNELIKLNIQLNIVKNNRTEHTKKPSSTGPTGGSKTKKRGRKKMSKKIIRKKFK